MRLGLRGTVLLSVSAVIVVGGIAGWLLGERAIHSDLREELRRRAELVRQAIEASLEVELAIKVGATAEGSGFLQTLLSTDSDLVYLIVSDSSGTGVIWATRGESAMLAQLEEPARRATLLETLRTRSGQPSDAGSLVEQVFELRRSLDVAKLSPEDEILLGELPDNPKKRMKAQIFIGLSPEVQLSRTRRLILTVLATSGVAVTLLLWLLFGRLFRRISHLREYADRLAGGDFTHPSSGETGPDEVGDLGRALSAVTHNLGRLISRASTATRELGSVSTEVSEASRQAASDAEQRGASQRDTAMAIAQLSESGEVVEKNVLEATSSAQESANRLRDVSSAIDAVLVPIEQLVAGVGDAQNHFRQNLTALADLDAAVDRLTDAAQNTATASTEISANIRSVDDHAKQALKMSQEASERADSGVVAVEETRRAVERLREVTGRSVESIRFLAAKVESIEAILHVIDDIAAQTRLLSLNASIIAAQAGEHGKGFGVVAQEIKDLAVKTAGSTREIAQVIQEVLTVSGKTIDVVSEGVNAAEEAAAQSRHGSEVLSQILSSSSRAGNLVRGIATAMGEQTRGADQVSKAMHDVLSIAQRTRAFLASQKNTSGSLQNAMQQMQKTVTDTLTSARAQAEQVRRILVSLQTVFSQFKRISEATRAQGDGRRLVGHSYEDLSRMSERHDERSRALAQSIERAVNQVRDVDELLRAFRV